MVAEEVASAVMDASRPPVGVDFKDLVGTEEHAEELRGRMPEKVRQKAAEDLRHVVASVDGSEAADGELRRGYDQAAQITGHEASQREMLSEVERQFALPPT